MGEKGSHLAHDFPLHATFVRRDRLKYYRKIDSWFAHCWAVVMVEGRVECSTLVVIYGTAEESTWLVLTVLVIGCTISVWILVRERESIPYSIVPLVLPYKLQ